MTRTHIRATLRNIAARKGQFLLNISGLTVGLAVCLLILLWVQDERSYDRFHHHADDIYTVVMNWDGFPGGGKSDATYAPFGPTAKHELPEVAEYVRIDHLPRLLVKYRDKTFYESHGLIADPALFEVFSFPLIRGNPKSDLTGPFDIMISSALATKYFGSDDPLGKTMTVEGYASRVRGVFADVPHNSHLRFDIYISFQFAEKLGMPLNWASPNYPTYLRVREGADIPQLEKKLQAIGSGHQDWIGQGKVRISLTPLKDIYLDPDLSRSKSGDAGLVFSFLLVAIALLLIACINYINLTTARSATRALEVGIRKTCGASRRQLMQQFLMESIFFVFLSGIAALVLADLLLPWFNRLSGKHLVIGISNPMLTMGLVPTLLVTGVLAGLYPAVYLSSAKPLGMLQRRIDPSGGSRFLRHGLVTVQFVLSIMLILSTAVIYRQIHHMKTMNLGFDRENILSLPIKENIGRRYAAFKKELLRHPDILSVTAKDCLPTTKVNTTTGIWWPGKSEEQETIATETTRVDFDYFNTMDLTIASGRSFSIKHVSDEETAFILNEEAVRRMDLPPPVVGGRFALYGKQGTVIGVMKNAHLKSLHSKIEPQVYHLQTDWSEHTGQGVVLMRISGKNVPATLAAVRSLWQSFNPVSPFEYDFLDQTYDALYHKEIRTGRIMSYFTLLALFISCLGMFGLASFTTERRTKEIGIRKAMGASVTGIMSLLTKEFSRWVALACVLAWPVSYLIMNRFLQAFAYRTSLGPWIFLLAGALALGIALLSVSFQTVRAARANPVDSLRYE